MGIFSKIKQNFNHGGVDLKLQAPASASMQDGNVPITLILTNTSSQPQTINSVTAEIIGTTHNPNLSQSNNTSYQSEKSVSKSESNEKFVLTPNESKSVQLNLIMNIGEAISEQLPENSGLAQVAGALGKLQQVGDALSHNEYTYEIRANADVEGITFDPGARQPIQLLKPGQIGGAINIHL